MTESREDPGKVSIVLTTLNGARYLQESVASCLAQTYQNIELIVVDGGSTDGTLEILARCRDPRLRIVHQHDNTGRLPGALNLGLAAAQGVYLTWHQDDCTYEPDAIEMMVAYLEAHPEVDQVYADWWLIKPESQPEWIHVCPPDEILQAKSDPVGVCFLIRRKVRETVGEHRIEAYPSQDYDYRMRIALQFESGRIQRPMYHYRYHDASLTGRLGWPLLARKDVETRLYLGISSRHQARLDLAEIDIAEAFEQYQNGGYKKVPGLVWAGLLRNWRYAANLGLWSILLRSLSHRFTRRPNAAS